MTKIFFILSLLSITFLQCDEPTPPETAGCSNAEAYVMEDFSGLAGCGWMLVKGDQRYEPINLADFYDTFGADVSVMVEVKERPDMASACQAGIIVEILCKN